MQPEQSKDPLQPGSGAIASDPAREQKKLPKGEQAAADDSRMTRSSSGAIARGPGGKAMK